MYLFFLNYYCLSFVVDVHDQLNFASNLLKEFEDVFQFPWICHLDCHTLEGLNII